ncbi:MAG: exo-alpha-sialidase [Methylococcales bacterium]
MICYSLFSKILIGICLLGMGWQTGFAKSSTKTFPVRELTLPVTGISQQHHLAKTADGRLIVSWVERDEQSSTVRFSVWDKKKWLPVQTVLKVAGKLGAPPVVLGLNDGALAAAWMPYVPNSTDKYAADIYVARSEDGGISWGKAFKPYGDAARIYDAQMSLTALLDGKLALVWTDMRYVSHEPNHDMKANRFQLMATVIDKQALPTPEITLDNDVCSCCSVFTDAQGDNLVSVYRDHTIDEIRDTSAVRWTPQKVIGATRVHDDHWHIEGCPSNGPAVALFNKQVAVAWFSAADGIGRVKLGFSKDGGEHFATPIEIDANANGYADTLFLDDGSALVSWRARVGAEDALRIARVSQSGRVTQQSTIYQGSFPKWPSRHLSLKRIGKEVFIAWTDPVQKKVRLAVIKLTKRT